jgi:hypothetical protein
MHDGSQNLSWTRFVHEDVSGRFGSLAYKRELAEAYLHQPLELMSQESINQEDIECALVVGYEYIRGVFLDIRITLHLHGQEQCVAEYVGPNLSWPIAPEMGIADATTDDDC